MKKINQWLANKNVNIDNCSELLHKKCLDFQAAFLKSWWWKIQLFGCWYSFSSLHNIILNAFCLVLVLWRLFRDCYFQVRLSLSYIIVVQKKPLLEIESQYYFGKRKHIFFLALTFVFLSLSHIAPPLTMWTFHLQKNFFWRTMT